MMMSKHFLHTAAGFLAMLAWTLASILMSVRADEPPAAKRDAAWVDKRVEEWQPTQAERAFDEIGWAKDLGEARRLAEEHGRPIFLFTYDGADLACYRC